MQIQQKQARGQTNRQVDAISRQIIAVYDDAAKSITDELEKLYAKYLTGPGIDSKDYYNIAIVKERLAKLKAQIAVLYGKESIKAGFMTAEASSLSMSNAYYKNQFVLDFFGPTAGIDLTFTALPPELVRLSVTGNIERWQALEASLRRDIQKTFGNVVDYIPKDGETLSALLIGNRRQEIVQINRAITSGLLQGKGFEDTARDVKKIIGKVSPTQTTGAYAKALRIVRTESNRTYNAGSFANTQAVSSQDIEIERIWVATLDSRTRDTHQALDGQRAAPDEPFEYGGDSAMYPGDFPTAALSINCRCTVIDAVDGIPPSARIGRNEEGVYETFDWQNYETWAKGQGLKQLPSGRWA